MPGAGEVGRSSECNRARTENTDAQSFPQTLWSPNVAIGQADATINPGRAHQGVARVRKLDASSFAAEGEPGAGAKRKSSALFSAFRAAGWRQTQPRAGRRSS